MPVSILPTTPRTPGRRQPIVPSPAFGLLLAGVAVSWWALVTGALSPGPALCALGLTGWLASLCLHEFAHALAAYRLGDLSVADKGYLTLNPLRYADPVTSLVLPVLFLAIGGFALPGACVFIDHRALRGRHAPALVSAADIAVRIIPSTSNIKVGVLTSLIGVPFFLYLIMRERRALGGGVG